MKTPCFLWLSLTLLTALIAAAPVDSTSTIHSMIEDWQRAKQYTMDYLDVMPEDGYAFTPTDSTRTFAQQYLHIAAVNFRYVAAATGSLNPYPGDSIEHVAQMQSREIVIDVTMKSYDAVIDGLKKMTEPAMAESAKLYRFELPKEEIFKKAFEHQTHHRGQTTIYIRMKGIKPPFERLF